MHYLIIAVLAFGLSLMGCEGKTGPAGPQGSAGAAGPQGATGPQGPPGTPGAKGEQGERGPAGPQGEQGEPGKDGADGADGKDGAGSDPAAIQEIINDVVAGGALADVHHILIIQDGEAEAAARRVNAPDFDDSLATIVLLVDDMTTLAAKAGSQDGEKIQVPFSWGTDNSAIADVDAATGVVTGRSNGTTNITLSAVGRGIEVDIPVHVYKSVDTVVIDPSDAATLTVGATRVLTAEALDASEADMGVPIPGVAFTWNSSDESKATVTVDPNDSSMATVTAVSGGSTNITATAQGVASEAVAITVIELETPERRLWVDTSNAPFARYFDNDLNDDGTADDPVLSASADTTDNVADNITINVRLQVRNLDANGNEIWVAAANGLMVDVASSDVTVLAVPATLATAAVGGVDGVVSLVIAANNSVNIATQGDALAAGTVVVTFSEDFSPSKHVQVVLTAKAGSGG